MKAFFDIWGSPYIEKNSEKKNMKALLDIWSYSYIK